MEVVTFIISLVTQLSMNYKYNFNSYMAIKKFTGNEIYVQMKNVLLYAETIYTM